MAGRHEFTPTPAGYVAICKYCGETEEELDAKRVGGKLPPCPDAPENEQAQGIFFIHSSNH